MKILILNYEFPPLGGGAGNATYYLLKEFAKNKEIEIDLVTSSADKYGEEEFSDNINIYYLNIGKRGGNFHNQSKKDILKYSWKAYKFCRKLKKSNDYDLTHAFFGIPCGFIAMLLRSPYIVSLRGSDVPFYSEKYKYLDMLVFRWLSKIIWRKARKVVANSSDLRDLAYKTYSKKEIEVIPNGVDIEEFKPRQKPQKYQKTVNILSTSRLTARKGVGHLLQAFKELTRKNRNIKLILVGEGGEEAKFRQFTQENNLQEKVLFQGLVSHDKIAKEYNKADVFVLPSFNEGMSNSLLEALASGLAIVSTDTGGAKDLIGKENGFIVEKGSPKSIKKALEDIIKNPEKLERMKGVSRQKALELSWGRMAGEYTKTYEVKNGKNA
jgi:glycosyltransferase involved in cell wall biosynthesis